MTIYDEYKRQNKLETNHVDSNITNPVCVLFMVSVTLVFRHVEGMAFPAAVVGALTLAIPHTLISVLDHGAYEALNYLFVLQLFYCVSNICGHWYRKCSSHGRKI